MNEKQTKGNILITIKKSSNDLERNKTKERKKENTWWRRQNENWKEKPKKKKTEEKRKTHNEEAKSYPKKTLRNQMKEQRAARTSEAENAIQTFLQMIKQEPTYIWFVCHRLMYRGCVVLYNVNVF